MEERVLTLGCVYWSATVSEVWSLTCHSAWTVLISAHDVCELVCVLMVYVH